MGAFVVRRLLQAVVLIKCVLVFLFLLLHITGDPVMVMAPEDATEEDIKQITIQMGFDKPLYVQYYRFFSGVIKGDWGESYEHEAPAFGIVMERLPATIQLTAVAFSMSVLIGIPLGCFAALKENQMTDRACMIGAVFGQALPNFWLGLMMILFFSVTLKILPSYGRGTPWHFIMPAFVASSYQMARLARLMRSEMLEVLRQDYILTARSKGLNEKIVLVRHALKNSAIPIVTILGIDLGIMLGGTVIVETVFAWPGVGKLTIDAINTSDFPVVQVAVFVLASVFILINTFVDILYTFLDPRLDFRKV